MNRDIHPSLLKPSEYPFMMNGNTENELGDRLNINNEPSNYLTIEFTADYKVIGFKKDLLLNRTYYFLTNPFTKKSSIGYVDDTPIIVQNEDDYTDCEECNGRDQLGTPLEELTQTPSHEYIEILNDICHEIGEGLNFDLNFPIKFVEIKQEKLGTNLYWTDYLNPPRWMNVTNTDYLFLEEVPCEEDIVLECFLPDKLLQSKKHSNLTIQPELLQIGGQLRLGSYEFQVAYCDQIGNEITSYSTPTNPIRIFDENNQILIQTELDSFTNYAIKLKVENLDTSFQYYKVVVSQRTNVNNTQSYFVEGIHPTTDDTIIYSSEANKERIAPEKIYIIKPVYTKAKGIVSSNKISLLWGLETRKEINLQPVVNLMGGFLKWQSSVAKEGLFKSAIATSKYTGYPRNEVQPFAIRFLLKTGGVTANFPFISRPANENDLEVISEEDPNRASLIANLPNCADNEREKRWQIFNTATVTDSCNTFEDNIEIEETLERTCVIEEVAVISSDTISFNIGGTFVDLETYINDNYEEVTDPSSDLYIPEIAPYLVDTYPDDHCTPLFGETCDEPVLTDSQVYIDVVVNEIRVLIEKTESDYLKNVPPDFCSRFKFDVSGGGYERDTDFEEDFMPNGSTVYKRTGSFNNESCGYATTALNNNDVTQGNSSAFHRYIGSDVYTDIITTKDAYVYDKQEVISFVGSSGSANININGVDYGATFALTLGATASAFYSTHKVAIEASTGGILSLSGSEVTLSDAINGSISTTVVNTSGNLTASIFKNGFFEKISQRPLWFKIPINGREKLVFEVTKATECEETDDIPYINKLRYTFFSSCGSSVPLGGAIVDMSIGELVEVDLTVAGFPPNEFYVVIDAPTKGELVMTEGDILDPPTYIGTGYRTAPPCGCFGVYSRDLEYSSAEVTFDQIIINKKETYSSTCVFFIPKVDDCDPIPYAKGDFAYYESTELYPDNAELYDSSTLVINEDDFDNLSVEQRLFFLDNYSDGVEDEVYNLKDTTNFQCQPIRHPKFPDNNISPFVVDTLMPTFAETLIFPMGISLDNKVVDAFLKIARNNGLITEQELQNIEGYEILRADNTAQKSVIANGLGYDMYQYSEKGNEVLYANFPHNDLGQDLLHLENGSYIQHPFEGESNNNFSILSPDLLLNKLPIPTEIVMSGYQMGNSRNFFNDVDEHSKWVILTRDAKDLATRLAVAEVALEFILNTSQLIVDGTGDFFINIGLSSGTNAVGVAISAIAIAAYISAQALNAFTKVGALRYQWLQTFRDLGTPQNFASYSASEGYHNRFLTNETSNDYIRGISVGKNLKDYRRYSFLDEKSEKRLTINSYLREYSTFISTGEYNFNYSSEYSGYDNNTQGDEIGSRTIASQNGCDSLESIRNVGSPYFTLKNWIQDQYGKVDSIKWLTTNYKNKLDIDSECETIFGGNVSISRFTWKRKIPIFTQTAFRLADRLPFNYSDYPNIARPKYYVDYETGGESSVSSVLFPDIDTDASFDCASQNRMYKRKPSKFYLWYYGITNFLVESEINCNFRYGGREPKDQFFPLAGDIVEWTQEKNVSIAEPNKFFYNNVYSTPVSNTPYKTLDRTYNEEIWELRRKQDNAVIYSEQDNSENDLVDPWLIFKPLNWYEFPKKYGTLIQLKDLESAQVLGRFEHQQVLFNAIDSLADRITPQNKELGTSGMFAQRPLEFKATDLGYAGTQHSEMVSTPFGHFTVDAKRGQIFMLDQSGRDLQPISERTGQNESGMKNWFREHLPFKILRDLPQIDIDNKFKGIGMNIWWDARFSRVFFTKRDYKLKAGILKTDFEFTEERKLMYQDAEVYFDNETLFEDASWTISYKVTEGSWNSYFSWFPDYSVAHQDYFQAGYNWGEDKGTMWSHLLSNQSFQVFQGKRHDFIIEVPLANQNVSKILNTLSLNIEGKRYQNQWDYTQHKGVGFNKAVIYNNTNNSGLLELVEQKSLSDTNKYPKTKTASQEILYTSLKGKHTFNYFYNRVRNQDNNIPIWINDSNRVNKILNQQAISFTGKKLLERIEGEQFIIRLINDKESRFNILLKNLTSTETNYE